MDLVYLVQYNTQTTAGLISAIVESDTREGFEFVRAAPKILIVLLLLYCAVLLTLFFQAGKRTFQRKNYSVIATALLIILPLIDLSGRGASARSFPLGISHAIYLFSKDSMKANKLIKQRANFRFNAQKLNNDDSENYILVIGETARRDYQQIYGYTRETNPNIMALNKDSLAIFTDAISPANATIPSLKSMLYMATAKDDQLFFSTNSIVSLAKEAGYKTYWLSSQARFGKNDSTSGSTGIEADVKIFINQKRNIEPVYDEELLPHLKDGFTDKVAKNKFFVMHLYGSHLAYNRRYPKSFTRFKDIPSGYENHPEDIQNKVNQYTNSIAYTDFILSKIIKMADSQKAPSCAIYTSDHGEYLAENSKEVFTGHGYPIPHKSEIDVPLFIWCSQSYRKRYPTKWNDILNNQKLAINNEDLFFSLADLMHINFKLMKPERSFFNKNYAVESPRKVISTSNTLFDYPNLK